MMLSNTKILYLHKTIPSSNKKRNVFFCNKMSLQQTSHSASAYENGITPKFQSYQSRQATSLCLSLKLDSKISTCYALTKHKHKELRQLQKANLPRHLVQET